MVSGFNPHLLGCFGMTPKGTPSHLWSPNLYFDTYPCGQSVDAPLDIPVNPEWGATKIEVIPGHIPSNPRNPTITCDHVTLTVRSWVTIRG